MSILNSIRRNCILLMAFLIPSPFYGLTLAVLALLFVLRIYTHGYKNFINSIRQPQILFPVLMYIYIFGGFFFSIHFSRALASLSVNLPYLIFPLVVGTSSFIDEGLIEKCEKCFVYSICIWLTVAILFALYDVLTTHEEIVIFDQYYRYSKFRSYGLTRVFSNWHPTFVSMFANLGIAIILRKFRKAHLQNKKKWIPDLASFLFLSIGIFLLNSLTGIIIYTLLLLIFGIRSMLVLKINRKIRVGVLILLSMLTISIFYFNVFSIAKIESLKTRTFKITDREGERNLLTMRLAKWETHLEIIKTHWLFGTTAGDIKVLRKEAYKKKGFVALENRNYNAHNEYIEIMATYGLIGFVIFISMMFFPLLRHNYQTRIVPFLFIIAVSFLTESVLYVQQGLLFFMFFYSLYTHQYLLKQHKV